MRIILISVILFYICNAADVWQYDLIPEHSKVNNSDGLLGICYGSSTSWATYPYAVALRSSSGSACCSGTIISTNPGVILTAAHCSGCTGQIQVGCSNPSSCNGQGYTRAAWSSNPSYGSPLQYSNDIAVVRTTSAITVSGATALSIPTSESGLSSLRLTGYGVTQSGSIPTSLQTMVTNVVARTTCASIMSSALGGGTYIDNSMICVRGGAAGATGTPTMCSGDSGGPGVAGSGVYGANSWGLQGSGSGCTGCSCCSGYPQVTSSSVYNGAWIRNQLLAWTEQYALNETELAKLTEEQLGKPFV